MAQITLNSSGVASSGSLLLQTNGTTTQATVDTSGNLGLGVTPSAWDSAAKAIQVGSFVGLSGFTDYMDLSTNSYYGSGSYRYLNSSRAATTYAQTAGQHRWYNAPTGTAGNAITFTQAMTLDASGNLGVGTTSPAYKLEIKGSSAQTGITGTGTTSNYLAVSNTNTSNGFYIGQDNSTGNNFNTGVAYGPVLWTTASTINFVTNSGTNNMVYSSGNLLVGKTALNNDVAGVQLHGVGIGSFTRSSNIPLYVNRLTDDGTLVEFSQAGVAEGTISVSGTTVSYNGGHLARYAQTVGAKDESLVKGTVLSNLDEMNVYTDAEGNIVANEQLNKVKVSDVEGDANVAGVFVNWSHDEQHNVDEINMAMTGDMIIRIAQGTTIARGDLLMSAGNGTAKPQGDDIVRAKTIAKVTSTHVTCTYEDGSYCVPCVLMAC